VSNDCESNATRYKGETMYSKAILIGRLGKKPEARITQTGKELVNMSLAVSERKDETTWFNLSAFGKTGEYAVTHLDKGDLVCVETNIGSYETTNKETGKKVSQYQFTVSSIRRLQKKNGDAEERQSAPEVELTHIPF
jgi:single-strand DNA-binding protein